MVFNDKLQISNGVNNVAVSNGNKIYVMDNKKNLVIDGNTLKEIDGAGNVTWTLNEFSSWEGNNYNFEIF